MRSAISYDDLLDQIVIRIATIYTSKLANCASSVYDLAAFEHLP